MILVVDVLMCKLLSVFNNISTSIQTLFWCALETLLCWDEIVGFYPPKSLKIAHREREKFCVGSKMKGILN